jgi:dihydrofolate reductase
MALIEYSANLSLDGYIEDEDGSLDWSSPSEEVHRYWNRLTEELNGNIMGRRLYETMIPFWPEALANPQGPDYVDEFARAWDRTRRLVASRTLTSVEGGCELIEGDPAEFVAGLRSGEPGVWGVGGPELADSLQGHGLIDRVRMMVMPVLLGGGKPFFGQAFSGSELNLLESRQFSCGSLMLLYELV